jgi:hypothetical protein
MHKNLVSLIFLVLLANCSRNDSLDDLTVLTGRWIGTQDIYQAGSCTIGGGSHAQSNVLVEMEVNANGDVVVYDDDKRNILFLGEVDNDLEVNLTTWFTVGCPDSSHSDSAEYEGYIRIFRDHYELNMDATERWCPPECIFEVTYQLRLDLD